MDDGSSDATRDVVGQFGMQVEYVHQENRGKASALAATLPQVDSQYVWYFDDDDWAYPDALERMLGVIDVDPRLGFAFGAVDKAKTTGRLTEATVRRGDYRWRDDSIEVQRLRLYRECTVMMTGALLRTSAIRGVGGISARQLRGQDYDLLIRLAASYSFAFCDASVYIFREHDGLRGTSTSQHRWRDRIASWAKYSEAGGYFLRYQLPISRFRSDPQSVMDDPATCRSALIARAWATAPKLPLHLPVSDLVEAFWLEPNADLGVHDRMCLREMFHDEFVAFRRARALFSLWRLALTPVGARALDALARSAYWRGCREQVSLRRVRWIAVAIPLWLLSAIVRAVRRDEWSSFVAIGSDRRD